jgi:peptidoglycan/LPS O-acetylase OafA/YrhL
MHHGSYLTSAIIANMRYIAGLIYVLLMSAWIYGAVAREPTDLPAWMLIPVLLAQIGVGYAVGQWWAALLPLGLVLIAVPAGYGADASGDIPVWVGVLLSSAVAAPLIAIGVAARQISERGYEDLRRR